MGLFQKQRLPGEQLPAVRSGGIQNKVDAAKDCLCHLQRAAAAKFAVVEAIHQVLADLELLLELGVGGLSDVHIAVVAAVPLRVLIHGCFQRRGDAHIIDNEAPLLVLKHSVDPGDGLHQVVAGHGLVDVHGGQGGYVKACQPHVHHNGDFHRVVVVLEFSGQLLLVALCADNRLPLLRVVVAAGHDNPDFLRPAGPQLQQLPVDLHGDGPGEGHDHGLSGEEICPVILVVGHNVLTQ